MKINLTDIIDVATLQEIQDGFSNATGMAALTTDADGVPVTKGSNFTEFCMELTRKTSTGCKRCEECDRMGAENTSKTGTVSTYYCHAGLVDFAAPIMLNGVMIGSFIGGQVLPQQPNEEKFRNYALEIGVNPESYVSAVKKVEIIEKSRIDAAAQFLATIANVLSKIAYSNFVQSNSNFELKTSNTQLLEQIGMAQNLISSNTRRMEKLNDGFKKLEGIGENSLKQVNSTNETVKVIQNIAMNTRILGFNAYIEAARAKESGKGFGVITQEIRGLADESKVSADKIESAIKSIGTYATNLNKQIAEMEKIIKECMDNMNMFYKILNNIAGNSDSNNN